jgi:hypothetical protein
LPSQGWPMPRSSSPATGISRTITGYARRQLTSPTGGKRLGPTKRVARRWPIGTECSQDLHR